MLSDHGIVKNEYPESGGGQVQSRERCVSAFHDLESAAGGSFRVKPMYLHSVEEHEAAEPHATMFRQMRAASVPIPQIMHLFAFKPERTDHLARFTQEVMRGPSPLLPGQRELIAALTSKLNQCLF